MFESFEKALRDRKNRGLYRRLTGPKGVDFVSNDYLGLSSHPQIRKTMIRALEEGLPLSGKASRLLSGTSRWHEETESLLGKFISRRGVLAFSSGYMAGTGVLQALARGKTVFSDELNHASLIDGISLSKSPCKIYPHNDLDVLESLLQKQSGEKIIVTESLFSMEGDLAPLENLSDLALRRGALLVVDEAHATGIFGSRFAGLVSDLKEKEHIVTLHTGGKALGGSGAFVGSNRRIKDYLINYCRSFIYTTAPPPAQMVQWKAALKVLEEEPFRPLTLRKNARNFRKALAKRFPVRETESPIVPLLIESPGEALKIAEKLGREGWDIRAVRPPTVPEGKERLRIVLKYAHSLKELTALKESLFRKKQLIGAG